jgi:primosomal protein DnaI
MERLSFGHFDRTKYNEITQSIIDNEEVQAFIARYKMTDEAIKKSLPKFNEYLGSVENDAFCDYLKKLVYHEGLADVVYVATAQTLEKQRLKKNLRYLKNNSIFLDETIEGATFENFNIKTDDERKAFEFAHNLAEFYKNGGRGNAFMSGIAGSGKSHLSMAILKQIIADSDFSVAFVSFSQAVRMVKDSFSNRDSFYTQDNVFRLLVKPDLLVLDDVGAEKITDFSENMLMEVMDSRVSTIITTNLSSDSLKELYRQRTTSRLFRGVGRKAFNFNGIKDKRILPF